MMYTFDDGSTITNEQNYSGWTTTSTPATDGGVASYVGNDGQEAGKFNSYYPQGAPWWAGLATYGATRAIDAAVTRINPPTGQPNTFAGANGRTYVAGAPGSGVMGGGSLLPLVIAGALVYLAVR